MADLRAVAQKRTHRHSDFAALVYAGGAQLNDRPLTAVCRLIPESPRGPQKPPFVDRAIDR